MAPCKHRYRDRENPCPREATPGNDRCIWHNPRICKSDGYVADLLRESLPHEGADLEGCHLAGSQLSGVLLRKARLRGADLRDADLREADLRNADLREAILRRADLRRAKLTGACLDGCDLTDCILSEANCQEASLRGALIDGTVLLATDLRDADLGRAQIRSFAWNRLSRFNGIRGLEAQRSGSGDPNQTQAYASPFAMGSMDLSGARRGAGLHGSDPELERTRIYRSGLLAAPAPERLASHSSPAGPALEPFTPPLPQRQELVHYRRAYRRMLALSAAAVFIAVLTTVLSLIDHQALPERPPPPEVIVRPPPPVDVPSSAQVARINDLLRDKETLQNQLDQLQRHLDDERSARRQERETLHDARRMAELETARLRAEADRAVTLARRLERSERSYEETLSEARRLERMAAIMADGVRELRTERDRLQEQLGRELVDRHRINTLQDRADVLEEDLAQARNQLARTREHNEHLEIDLRRSELAMQAIASRVKGTALEALLGTESDDGPRLQLRPGRPLTLGGEHLITLRVEPAEQSGTILVQLVIQGEPGKALPDVSVLLYGPDGRALRTLSFAFPGQQTTSFAQASTIISCPQMPVAARVLLSPSVATAPELADGRRLDRQSPLTD